MLFLLDESLVARVIALLRMQGPMTIQAIGESLGFIVKTDSISRDSRLVFRDGLWRIRQEQPREVRKGGRLGLDSF